MTRPRWTCRTCNTVNPGHVQTCRGEDCLAAAAARRTNARIAVNTSWARTPIRSERTEAARRNSPGRLEYWIALLRAEGVVSEADIPAAAENARRAYMGQLVKKRGTKRATETS
ncbi:hypothetical protein [Actinomadura rubrisoli]|uniref:Uncharacterized protein n=1 Tax=Actinomadura rubrisoli TaxID=2530368 RepID=A0A4R5ABL9_9ACTN|nr:hypothetical protein [Actinomadura rubrisoli]TDD68576.1 hypothetical protein E1298_38240 [Actinomadura rubrisoli]